MPSLLRPYGCFLNRYYKTVVPFKTATVAWDLEIKKRRMAAYVAPTSKGRVVSEAAFATDEYRAPYIKETTAFDPEKNFERAIGEQIGGGEMDPLDRLKLRVAYTARERFEAVIRRKEHQAVSGAINGFLDIGGKGLPTVRVQFRRDPTLTIHQAGSDRWSDPASTPLKDVQNWVNAVFRIEGAVIQDIVMDSDAWEFFESNADVQKKLEVRNFNPGTGQGLAIGPAINAEGVMWKGTIGTLNFYVYSDTYVDPDTDVATPFLPSGTVMGMTTQILGKQLQGAIKDERAAFQAKEFWLRSWIDDDTSERQIQSHSAPLTVPSRSNACFSAQVLD